MPSNYKQPKPGNGALLPNDNTKTKIVNVEPVGVLKSGLITSPHSPDIRILFKIQYQPAGVHPLSGLYTIITDGYRYWLAAWEYWLGNETRIVRPMMPHNCPNATQIREAIARLAE